MLGGESIKSIKRNHEKSINSVKIQNLPKNDGLYDSLGGIGDEKEKYIYEKNANNDKTVYNNDGNGPYGSVYQGSDNDISMKNDLNIDQLTMNDNGVGGGIILDGAFGVKNVNNESNLEYMGEHGGMGGGLGGGGELYYKCAYVYVRVCIYVYTYVFIYIY
jgi:hypothetical protein